MKEKLSADEIRNLEEDTRIVVELHEDEYWMQGEGHVSYVKKYDSGNVEVGMEKRGYTSKLYVPADARKGLEFTGAAQGATNLKVDSVHRL